MKFFIRATHATLALFTFFLLIIATTASADSLVDGLWELTLRTPLGERVVILSARSTGRMVTGRVIDEGRIATPIYDGEISGNRVSWKTDVNAPMSLTLAFNGTIDGDTMSGTVGAGALGSWPFSGYLLRLPK